MSAVSGTSVSEALDTEIRFHLRWKRYCMTAYSCTTIGMTLATVATSLLAASSHSWYAAGTSSLATIFIGIEKSLLFREKWRLHLVIYTKLKALRRRVDHCRIETQDAIDQLNSILETYSSDLPIHPRE